jgi:enterochelin esterase-like enzyme
MRPCPLALVLLLAACTCPTQQADPQSRRVRQITVASKSLGQQPVVVVLPRGYDPSRPEPYPLLVAFSGRGEALRDPERGAWGWVRDYHLVRQLEALERGRLAVSDLLGLVSASRLARYNRSLAEKPFAGMVVACPHTYDLLGAETLRHPAYERFYLEELPAALRARFHLRRDAAGLGIDGVSLGGLWSLVLGFTRPERVGQIGALQPAVTPFVDQLVALAAKNRRALVARPIALVTSTADGLRPAVSRLSAALRHVKVHHGFTLLEGPHDYVFNQGPGGIQMLLWHDRRFQGLALESR